MTAKCATDTPNNPLWDFALNVYGLPGMASTLLELQEQQGADVLWLLTALWLGEQHKALPAEEAQQPAYEAWKQDFILPIRRLRIAAKNQNGELYDQLKQAEIEAEKTGLRLLFEATSGLERSDAPCERANLACVLPQAEQQLDELMSQYLQHSHTVAKR